MPSFADTAASALAQIQAKGSQIPISREDGRTFNPVTGAYSGGAPLTGNIWAVLLPVSSAFVSKVTGQTYAEELLRGEIKLLLAAASGAPYTPRVGDTVTMSDGDYNVIGKDTLSPDDSTEIIHNLVIQKASV